MQCFVSEESSDTLRHKAPRDLSYKSGTDFRGGRMKRLLAITVFLAGGFLAEMTHPVHCSLVYASRIWVKRRTV
jgi:hypothetical protein